MKTLIFALFLGLTLTVWATPGHAQTVIDAQQSTYCFNGHCKTTVSLKGNLDALQISALKSSDLTASKPAVSKDLKSFGYRFDGDTMIFEGDVSKDTYWTFDLKNGFVIDPTWYNETIRFKQQICFDSSVATDQGNFTRPLYMNTTNTTLFDTDCNSTRITIGNTTQELYWHMENYTDDDFGCGHDYTLYWLRLPAYAANNTTCVDFYSDGLVTDTTPYMDEDNTYSPSYQVVVHADDLDSFSVGSTATLHGSVNYITDECVLGKCLNFSTDTSFLEYADVADASKDITACGWFVWYADGAMTTEPIIGHWGGSNALLCEANAAGSFYCGLNNVAVASTAGTITDEIVYHFCFNYNHSKTALYINGTEVDADTYSGHIVDSPNGFYIGATSGSAPYLYRGSFDEITYQTWAESANPLGADWFKLRFDVEKSKNFLVTINGVEQYGGEAPAANVTVPSSYVICADNYTLLTNTSVYYGGALNNTYFYTSCPSGCDNISYSCNPPAYVSNIYNFVLVVGIITFFMVLIWRLSK